MVNAYRDENSVPTIITVSNADGVSIVRNEADSATNRFLVDDGTTGADAGNNEGNAMRDESSVPVWIAVSSSDGITPVEVYSDPLTQRLLINSQ